MCTSNRAPWELSPAGAHEDMFAHFVGVLTRACPPLELSSERDYRRVAAPAPAAVQVSGLSPHLPGVLACDRLCAAGGAHALQRGCCCGSAGLHAAAAWPVSRPACSPVQRATPACRVTDTPCPAMRSPSHAACAQLCQARPTTTKLRLPLHAAGLTQQLRACPAALAAAPEVTWPTSRACACLRASLLT